MHGAVDGRDLRAVLEVRLDCVVCEFGSEGALPVLLEAGGQQRIEQRVDGRVGHGRDELADGRTDATDGCEGLLGLVERAGPTCD